jgi:DNA-binding NtrC family response regulator
VKLLRVLETRILQRLGDTEDLRFQGRIVSATHRDLAELIAAGTFRHDLYQRLCACCIRTPSLREQLDDAPGELRRLVRFIAGKVRPSKADVLTEQVERWIGQNLPPDYPWPGNVRQLGQCVREIFVSGTYHPIDVEDDDPVRSIRAGTLSKDQLVARYAAIVRGRTGSTAETARVLGVHRHTVARLIDADEIERRKARLPGARGRPTRRR